MYLTAFDNQPGEGLLRKLAGIVFVPGEAISKPIQRFVERADGSLVIHFVHFSMRILWSHLFPRELTILAKEPAPDSPQSTLPGLILNDLQRAGA
jgi:hypothetical protein